MKTTLRVLFGCAAWLVVNAAAFGHTHIYQALLTGANEASPNASTAIGTSIVTLDLDLITMRLEIDFSGLTGNATAAFIHARTASAFTGTAGPMTPALASSGFPLGGASGSYDHTFDLTDSPGYHPSFITASGGTVSDALNALFFSFERNTSYLSIQSEAFPNGEIRGFFSEVTEAPEPAAALLLALTGGVWASFRRR